MSNSSRFAIFSSAVLAPLLSVTSALAQTPPAQTPVPTAQAVSPSAAPRALAPAGEATPNDGQLAGEVPADAPAASAPSSNDTPVSPSAYAEPSRENETSAVAQDQAASNEVTERRPGARRDSWYIGFALGTGPASSSIGDTTLRWGEFFEGTDSVRLSVDFEVGATISPKLLLGGRIHGMREATEVEGVEVALQHSQYLVNATYFPLETGEGPFVRGGVGLASLTLSVENDAGDREDASQGGIGTTLGLGYALWLGDAFNLTVSNDFSIASFSGDEDAGEPTSGWFNSTQLGFYWY